MDLYAFAAPVPAAFDIGAGFAFVAGGVGLVGAFAPIARAVRYAIDARGGRGLVPKLSATEGFGRASRRAA